jgi:hypothetical protein
MLQGIMATVFAKLNLKDQAEIVVVNAPASFEPALAAIDTKVVRFLEKTKAIVFSLAFVTTQAEVDALAPAIGRKAQGDATIWFAYPKGSSKRYTSQINRDSGWKPMGEQGFEPVRMVAIDDDWSAVRFRRVEFIKNMTRAKEHRLTSK